MNLIQQAVEPLRQAAMDSAEAYARSVVERVRNELAAAGNDLNIAAPRPRAWDMSRDEYMKRQSKAQLFSMLTKWRTTTHRPGTPLLADMADDRIAHFIKNARDDAAAQYEMYAQKLVHKIGEVTCAELTSVNEGSGENLWHYSNLRVVLVDGSTQNWRTRMIFNVSKLGKVFNQFPTRKVK